MDWDSYIGLPYKDRGRAREGVDCYGLAVLIYRERYHVDLPLYDCAGGVDRCALLIEAEKAGEDWREAEKPAEGDLVLLRQLGLVSHVGVCCSATDFLHCEEDIGVVRQALDGTRWRRRLCGFYRHRLLESVRVYSRQSPLSERTVYTEVEPGITVAALVERTVPPQWHAHAHVMIHGQPIPPAAWSGTVVREGALAHVTIVPRGTGRGILRAILTIAVLAWAGGAGGRFFARGLFGGTGAAGSSSLAWGRAFAGALGLMAINTFVPPPKPRMDDLSGTDQSNIYSIKGARNRLNQYGAVPVVLGTHRVYPPYAAKPYTLLEGDDQYLLALFAVGFGALSISDIKIGETAITSFSDVTYEVREGTPGDAPITIFPESVSEQQLNIALTYAAGAQTRTTEADTDEAIVDITFPRGLVRIAGDGSQVHRTVAFQLDYSLTGIGAWSNAVGYFVSALAITNRGSGYTAGSYALEFTGGGGSGAAGTAQIIDVTKVGVSGRVWSVTLTSHGNGYTSLPTVSIPAAAGGAGAVITPTLTTGYQFTAASAQPKRYPFTIVFPTQDQYDVRCTRISADSTSSSDVDEFFWTALRSVKLVAPINTPYDLAIIAVKIKASGQLNGIIETLSCIAKSRGKKWDTGSSTWLNDQDINNPADIYRLLLQGPFNAAAVVDSRIDLPALQAWSAFCDTKDFTFNAVLDSTGTLWDRLNVVAAAGRASPVMIDNKYSILIETTRTTRIQTFTSRNIKSFSGSRLYITMPHAFRCRFINEDNDYLQEERIVYADGYDIGNATLFEQLELFGVTDKDQIWKLARYHLAVSENRQEQFTIEVDAEHLVCTRGDLVGLQHDVPLIGIIATRAKRVSPDMVEVDDICTMTAGTYGILVRKSDGTFSTWDVVLSVGDNKILERLGGSAFDFAIGDVVVFGASGAVDMDALVLKIEMQDELAARLTLIPYVPGIYTADSGAIPSYDPQMTLPEELRPPNPPRSLAVAEFLYREAGTMQQGAILSWYHSDDLVPDAYECEVLRPGSGDWEALGRTTGTQIRIAVTPAGTYSFCVRALKGIRASVWVTLAGAVLSDLSDTVANVLDLRTAYRDGKILMTWARVDDIRDIEYQIRYGTSWASGTLLQTVKANEYFPITDGMYMVKAKVVDAEAYSADAATITIVGLALPMNVIESCDEDSDGEGWQGVCSGAAVPQMPTSFDETYEPGNIPEIVLPWGTEYGGDVLPTADGWTAAGTGYSGTTSSDGDILTQGTFPIGQTHYFYKNMALAGEPWMVIIARAMITAGRNKDQLAIYSATYGKTVVHTIDDTGYVELRIELCATYYRIYKNGVLDSEGVPGAYGGANDGVYFGKAAVSAESGTASWDYVYFGAFETQGDGLLEPDALGWALIGTDLAVVENDYLKITNDSVNPNAYQKSLTNGRIAVVRTKIYDNERDAYVYLRRSDDGVNGIQARIDITVNGVILIWDEVSSALVGQILLTLTSEIRVDMMVDKERVYVWINGRLEAEEDLTTGPTNSSDVRWGSFGNHGGIQKWWYLRAATYDEHGGALLMDGHYALTGYYTTDSGNQIDLGADGLVIANASVGYHGSDMTIDLLGIGNLYDETDLLFDASSKVTVEPQIRIKPDGESWGDWETFTSGQYTGREYDVRLRVVVDNEDIIALITSFDWSIDMEDRIDKEQAVSILAAGTAITFDTAFQVTPSVQVTQRSAVGGDTVRVTLQATTGFTVQVLDSLGAGKDATIDWIAKGY